MVKKPVGRDLILRQDTHRRRITATLADAPKTKADCEKAKDIAAPAQSRVSDHSRKAMVDPVRHGEPVAARVAFRPTLIFTRWLPYLGDAAPSGIAPP